MNIISWNMAHRRKSWYYLLNLHPDIALLQEASEPPEEIRKYLSTDQEPWMTEGPGNNRQWRAAIVKFTDSVDIEWIKPYPIRQAQSGQFAVSRVGTLSAAKVREGRGDEIILISMYGLWESPHRLTNSSWIYADASVHRLISDLSVFIGSQKGHRILAAGDLNSLFGYGEYGSSYWAERYSSIFSRMAALGLEFIGPQAPNGLQAEPWPSELPQISKNVPTYHSTHQKPESASRQLDFVIASEALADRCHVSAINKPEEWGPSDHCLVQIDLDKF